VFDRGRIAEEGNHGDLMQRAGVYRDLFTHQAAGLLEA
jgi:ABC-type multidrug transport system fused ATPase/permease subunit